MRTFVIGLLVLLLPLTASANDSTKETPSFCLMKEASASQDSGPLKDKPPRPPKPQPLPLPPKRPEPKPLPAPKKATQIFGRWDAGKKTCSPITVNREGKFSLDDLPASDVSAEGDGGAHCRLCPTYCNVLQYEAVRDSKGNIIGYHAVSVRMVCGTHSCDCTP
jgi:hypothetical protein